MSLPFLGQHLLLRQAFTKGFVMSPGSMSVHRRLVLQEKGLGRIFFSLQGLWWLVRWAQDD